MKGIGSGGIGKGGGGEYGTVLNQPYEGGSGSPVYYKRQVLSYERRWRQAGDLNEHNFNSINNNVASVQPPMNHTANSDPQSSEFGVATQPESREDSYHPLLPSHPTGTPSSGAMGSSGSEFVSGVSGSSPATLSGRSSGSFWSQQFSWDSFESQESPRENMQERRPMPSLASEEEEEEEEEGSSSSGEFPRSVSRSKGSTSHKKRERAAPTDSGSEEEGGEEQPVKRPRTEDKASGWLPSFRSLPIIRNFVRQRRTIIEHKADESDSSDHFVDAQSD